MRKVLFLLCLLSFNAVAANVNIGGLGDGTTDETATVQTCLSNAIAGGDTCVVESGKNYRIVTALYISSAVNLTCADSTAKMTFDMGNIKYPIQVGLTSSTVAGTAWSGTISNCTFVISAGTSTAGRFIWLAKASGGTITGNSFHPGNLRYSLTGSGVDGAFLSGAGNYTRTNITITNNIVAAQADTAGSEGIGLEGFTGATITGNTVSGVGDDLIGIHLMCSNVLIQNNTLSGVDGRVFISNSQGVTVNYNRISRGRANDGLFKTASSLIFVGHETAATNSNTAPKSIIISNNTLTYPEGALDSAAAIYMQGPRDTVVYNNTIYSDSSVSTGSCIYHVPFDFTGTWTDPDGLDTTPAKPRNLVYRANRCIGKYPKTMKMTSAGANHAAPQSIIDNIGTMSFYSPAVVTGTLATPPTPTARTSPTAR